MRSWIKGKRRAGLALIAAAAMAVPVASMNGTSQAADVSEVVKKVLDFDVAGAKPSKKYRVAYLTECIQNPYCQTRLKGLEDAAAKYGFEFKIFDANFNPAAQLKHVQNAIVEGFDGYLFAPAAAAPGCSMWNDHLKGTGKPVVSLDLPMCTDADYTAGLAATVTMQRQAYYNAHVDNAFASCTKPCEASAVGGFVGSDLFNFWENAIKQGLEKYPNVKMVSDEPGNFDPREALKKTQNVLLANPNIELVLSSWDDMSRGVEQAITAAGKKPGTDIRIYSIGGTKDGVEKVKAGIYNGTTVLLPYEESYYAGVALIMALEGQAVNAYVGEAEMPRVTGGPGTILITKENADKLQPNY